jgi:hypothetical protein
MVKSGVTLAVRRRGDQPAHAVAPLVSRSAPQDVADIRAAGIEGGEHGVRDEGL